MSRLPDQLPGSRPGPADGMGAMGNRAAHAVLAGVMLVAALGMLAIVIVLPPRWGVCTTALGAAAVLVALLLI